MADLDFSARSKSADLDFTQRTTKRKRSFVEEATGALANFNRGTAVGDELAAAGGVVTGLLTGRHKLTDPVVPAFKAELAAQRSREDDFTSRRPLASALAQGTGSAATVGLPGGQANGLISGSRALNVARGAVTGGLIGAGYAAADRGTLAERAAAANRGAAVGGLLGGAVGAAQRTQPRPMRQPTAAQEDGQILADVGVSTTIPQRMGRAAKGVEDILKRFPITGQAMAGYQDRQIEQLNRAIGLKALQPIGGTIPKDVRPGFAMVEHVEKALGEVYDQAAKLAPRVTLDEQLVQDAEAIGARRADLSESEARLFDSIVADRLNRLRSGGASGEMVKQIHSELGGLQAEAAKKGQDTLSSMVGDLRRAIMGTVERASPEARKLIRRADEGWSIYSIMNDAAAAASNRGGVFLPGQLNTQVRTAGRRIGSNMTGKGRAPLQDIATAASRTIPDTYGNPGTANAVLASGGGVGLITAPVQTIGAGVGLTAVATPYALAGRKIIESLPERASRAELMSAEKRLAELAATDPAVEQLRQQVAARLSRGAGVAGGQAGGLIPTRGSAATQ